MVKFQDAESGEPVWVNGANVFTVDAMCSRKDGAPVTRVGTPSGIAIVVRGMANEIAEVLHRDQNAIVEQADQFSADGIPTGPVDTRPKLVTS